MKKIFTYFVLAFFVTTTFLFADDTTQIAAPAPVLPPSAAAVSTPPPASTPSVASIATEQTVANKPEATADAKQLTEQDVANQPEAPVDVKKSVKQTPKPPRQEVRSVEKTNYFSASADRLGHGFGNIAYSLLEWPYRIGKEMERTNPVAATISGTAKGWVWAALRLTAGAVEAATFFIPFKPLIRDFDAGWFNA